MTDTKFFEPPSYNLDGRQQLWIDTCTNSHDTWCGCNYPTAHLLNCLLPPGHPDRQLTVHQLIEKALTTKWPSGGTGAAAGGTTISQDTEEEPEDTEDPEGDFGDDAINELLAAAAADVEPR